MGPSAGLTQALSVAALVGVVSKERLAAILALVRAVPARAPCPIVVMLDAEPTTEVRLVAK